MTKRKTLTIVGLLILLFLNGIFIASYTVSDRETAQNLVLEHAQIIENALWALDREAPRSYLSLVSGYYDYESISVLDENGNLFVEAKGPLLLGVDALFEKAGLIPLKKIYTDIRHGKEKIGSLIVARRVKIIYTTMQALGISVLLYVAYLFLLGIVLAKGELKNRVKERTQDLEDEVEERKRAEGELRQLRNYLANIIDSMPSMLVGVDAKGQITLWNKLAEQNTELDTETAIGKRIDEVFPNMVEETETIAESIQTQTVNRLQKTLHTKEDGLHYEDVTIYPLMNTGDRGAVIRIDDVTEEHRMREKITASEEKFRTLFESSRDAIILLNPDDGIFDCNPAALKMFAASSKSEMMQRHLWEMSPKLQPDGTPSHHLLRNCVEKVLSDGAHLWEWHAMALDERQFPTVALVTRIEFDGRTILQVNLRDITEHKEMEQRLRHSQKMEAVGQLAGGIAHDFNNQLTGILGLADLIRYRVQNDPELVHFANSIITSVRRASDITSELLAFSRKGQYVYLPVDMHRIIKEVITLLQHSIDKKIVIKEQLLASFAIVMGDPSQLQNVILNIALNSRDAMPNGGQMIFSTENTGKNSTDRTSDLSRQKSVLTVRVSDSGIGMDETIRSHIFEPFFTTKGPGKGTGMGLAAVYGTVKNHKGSLSVTSAPGQGTTFDISLPLAPEDATEYTPTKTSKPSKDTLAHILLVEDEEMLRQVTTKALEIKGHKVSECENGVQAIEIYQKHWKNIDLVILDIIMPEMDGEEAFAAMKNINPNVNVIVSSGFSLNDQVKRMMSSGAKGFIKKPYRAEEVTEMIENILGASTAKSGAHLI